MAVIVVISITGFLLVQRQRKTHKSTLIHPSKKPDHVGSFDSIDRIDDSDKPWMSVEEAASEWRRRFALLAVGKDWKNDRPMDAASKRGILSHHSIQRNNFLLQEDESRRRVHVNNFLDGKVQFEAEIQPIDLDEISPSNLDAYALDEDPYMMTSNV